MPRAHLDSSWIVAIFAIVMASTGFWGWLTERGKRKSAKQASIDEAQATIAESQATFVGALNKQSEDFIKALQADRRQLTRKVSRLEKRVEELTEAHTQCQGDYAQAIARMDGLVEVLRDAGVPIPGRPPVGSFVVVEGAAATMFTPSAESMDGPPPRRLRQPKEADHA
jgi:hypothetical protein